MRKLLNTLFVTSPNSYLSLDGENIVILQDGAEISRRPLHNLESIFAFGYQGASPALMRACAENNIGLCFLNPYGRFQARVSGRISGNVLLRKTQYRVSDLPNECVKIARLMIAAKLHNSRWILERAARDYSLRLDVERLKRLSASLKAATDVAANCDDIDELRGIEGEAAALYFSAFDDLILQQKENFFYKCRSRRPPIDNTNALLSFVYTILTNDIASALEAVGLDPYVGFMHTDRPGRASLALDLIEELRGVFADRFVITLINKKLVSADGFTRCEDGAVVMSDKTKKCVLTQWEERKREIITHPYLNEKIEWGLVPYVQALLLARHLRGDLELYTPFFWR